MKSIRSGLLGSLIWIACAASLPAQVAPPLLSFTEEQRLVSRLTASRGAADKRRLAEHLRQGLIASAGNPLRRPDRDGAIAAYRLALAAGDASPTTVIALSRLLLREDDGSGLKAMLPGLRKLMLQGNGDAAYVLALDAAQNEKLPAHEVQSRLEAAATMGSIAATLDLAIAGDISGGPVARAAIEMLQRRANAGSGQASLALYHIHRRAMLVERSPAEAMAWLARAVEQGHVPAIERMGEHLLRGLDIPRDAVRAATLFRQAAEAGSGSAAMLLGRNSGRGAETGVSAEEGRTWLRRAAEIGIRGAAVEISSIDLGIALQSGAATPQVAGMVEAALSPIAQDPEALSNLADRHWKTANSRIIAPLLMPLLREQALGGSAAAGMAYNGWRQANGEALPEDVAAALVKSLRDSGPEKAAFSNFTIASMALDDRLPATLVSRADAIELLLKAADARIGQAMWRLGQLYMHGDQLPASRTFASRWLAAAREQGVERAAWDLADQQTRDDDPAERSVGERFYLEKLDEGDPRAALELVKRRLRTGQLDAPLLARAQHVVSDPKDQIGLAALLIASGVESNAAFGHDLLKSLLQEELDDDALVAGGRLLVSIATSEEVIDQGLRLLKRAADHGSTAGRTALADVYLSSAAYRDRHDYAVGLLHDVLKDHPYDPEARILLSRAYLGGLGTKRDAAQAGALLAAVRAEGQYRNQKATLLAADWIAFVATERDTRDAAALLSAQAARGSVAAERALGNLHLGGLGRTITPDAAASRLHQAAMAGDREAMASLGHLFLNGHGLSQSRGEGLAWLARASEAGNTAAMYDLSRVHASAPASAPQRQEALHWLRRAADRNHPTATYQLGLAYMEGTDLPRDPELAASWFARSASSGNVLATRALETLRLQMAKRPSSGTAEVSHD